MHKPPKRVNNPDNKHLQQHTSDRRNHTGSTDKYQDCNQDKEQAQDAEHTNKQVPEKVPNKPEADHD